MKHKKLFSKETVKAAGHAIAYTGAIFLAAVARSLSDNMYDSYIRNNNLHTNEYDKKYITLDDAVDAIVNSSMYSDDKSDAIAAMKTDKSREYYTAIINIANSNMYSSSKREAIIRL